MESHQPQKYEVSKGQVEVQPPRQRRFRIVKLEERIAPKKGGNMTNRTCVYTYRDCPW